MVSLSEWVAQHIAAAPPLRPEQLDNLRALLAVDVDADDQAVQGASEGRRS